MLKPMFGTNSASTLVDGATARDIVAAPEIATDRHYIKWIMYWNETSGQNPVFYVYDADKVIFRKPLADVGDTATAPYGATPGWELVVFPTPIPIKVGAKISAHSTTATGDVWVWIGGFTGPEGITLPGMP